ncbi:hypothetical protein K435DRAFT_758848 [Dendrothele bispora CBS 962.96]|uniref:Uncharacterized protein n=1 Tax=Dendrothele bispora (strain CBS 962.96) TaxID=1314807 RepID=A0A4S8LRY5_DENBC|nr:hypothetical protein K435DRAFT_758848 [Dendrothele bispora CBS 962.96]
MNDHPPPPIYSQEDPDDSFDSNRDSSQQPQLLIVPTVDSVNFQKGFLGAEDERAAIEGELQIKGANSDSWNKVTVCLRTVETAFSREIELGCTEVTLWSSSSGSPSTALPSSILFAIPLVPDTPQSIHTPHSSLSHTLTAAIHPLHSNLPPVTKSLSVHTRRYTSHLHTLPISPETFTSDDPTRVEVQVPRTTFKSGDPIPLYVKIPPPRRELVIDEGLRLRNIKAELVRVVRVKRDDDEDESSNESDGSDIGEGPSFEEGPSSSVVPEKVPQPSSSRTPVSPLFLGSTYKNILARSGASCRFHSTRAIQLRFLMYQASPFSSPSANSVNLPISEHDHPDSDEVYNSITQTTLLHSVSFRINIRVSFVDVENRTERISTIVIPITLLPPSATLPEVGPSMDEAYQKKHDRPPVKTNRYEEPEHTVPHYSEGEAGPSALLVGAPPPFEERDAPPPFFSSAAEASTSARLPTFLESESEIIIPPDAEESMIHHSQAQVIIIGEGADFGFAISEQFDGHSEDMQRSSTPPPTLEMASRDTDVTQLAEMAEPGRAIEALGLVLNQQEDNGREVPPPPPPALDDPSDPPPSIDSDFRSPDPPRSPPHSASPHPVYSSDPPEPSSVPVEEHPTSHGHAPPPYLVPDNHSEHVIRPPPYVD